jgi:hypothetical protein
MGTISIKIQPSLISMATATWCSAYATIDYRVEGATTIGEVLAAFTREHREYHVIFFDTLTGKISDAINVTLNRKMLVSARADTVGVKDGDTVIIMPVYEGG